MFPMRCTHCGTQWPDELKNVMKFCGACGSPLGEESAPAAPLPADAAPVPRSESSGDTHPPDPGGELRFVTVLFADLADFTAFAEDLPPDEVAHLVGDLLQRLGKVVEQFGGGVDKFLGDALLATFGMPNPDPNAARNAVRAGLAMQAASAQYNAETGLDLGLRIGIHAGEVMSRFMGGSWTVMGDTVNTASRIQSAATPGKVWISRPVYEEVRRYFTLFARSVVDVKGKKQAVQPYEVIGERQVPFADLPPFVGRDVEWQFLQDALAKARQERTLQTVLVRGPAGVGKSRLVWELRDWVQKQPEVYWVDLVQYDTSERLPSHGLNALLRSRLGLPVEMDEQQTLALLHERLQQEGLFGDPESTRRAADHFSFILGVSAPDPALQQSDSRSRWEDAFLAVKDWLERRDPEGMTVWFIEDIQKGDADTAAFFEWALQVPWRAPALVILTAREEDFDPQSSWHAPLERWLQQDTVLELHLREIPPPVIAQAIECMAGGQIPPELALRIAEHTEGNPLFATEIVLLLKERGILDGVQEDWQHLALPGSIREVMEARIERLGLNGKDVAKRGALMGRRFTRGAVERVWDRSLLDLENGLVALRESETTYEEASKLFLGEKEDVFRHGRLHEAVLARIPREERLKWLKELGAWALDKLEQQSSESWHGAGLLLIPLIARSHEEHAESWLASLWSEVLGNLHLDLDRYSDAIQSLRQALATAQGVRRLVLGQQVAQAASTAGQYDLALQEIAESRQPGPSDKALPVPPFIAGWLDTLHDQPLIEWRTLTPGEAEMALDLAQAEILAQIGQVEDARRIFMDMEQRLEQISPERPDPHSALASLWLRWSRSTAYFLSEILSQHAAALQVCHKLRQRFDLEEFSDDQRLTYLYSESLVEMQMGHHERARQLVEERLRIARQHGLLREEANIYNFMGNLAAYQGAIEESCQHYQHSLELARQLGQRRAEAIILFNLGEAFLQLGEWEQAQQYCEQYLVASHPIGNRFAQAYAPMTFSAIDLARGNFERAARWIDEAMQIARQNGWLRLEGQILSSHAFLLLQRGLVERRLGLLQEAAQRYLELDHQHSLETMDETACLVLALYCAGQVEAAQAALHRAEAAANPQSELDQAWLHLLDQVTAGQPATQAVEWFRHRRHAVVCLLAERVSDYLSE